MNEQPHANGKEYCAQLTFTMLIRAKHSTRALIILNKTCDYSHSHKGKLFRTIKVGQAHSRKRQ